MIEHIDAFLTACRAAHLSQHTLTWYANNLRAFVAFVDGRKVTPGLVREFVCTLEDKHLSVPTIHGYLRTLKRLSHWCCNEGLLSDDPMLRIQMPRLPRLVPRGAEDDDFQRLLATCDDDWLGVRDVALLYLLRDTGCRASEISNLRVKDLELKKGFLKVLGKGGQERFAFVSEPTVGVVMARLAVRDAALAKDRVFHARRGEFTALTLNQMLRRRKREAGITGRVNPHSFRHAFARDWLQSRGDLASLSQVMGHRDLRTTMVYATLATADLQAKHARHSPLASCTR